LRRAVKPSCTQKLRAEPVQKPRDRAGTVLAFTAKAARCCLPNRGAVRGKFGKAYLLSLKWSISFQ